MRCPNSKNQPSAGTLMAITGALLPTVMTVLFESDLPLESFTVSLAVKRPGVVYVWVGFGAVESTVPLLSKSHSNVSASPGSRSREPAEENSTVSGAGPLVRLVLKTPVGARWPLTYSHLYMPASALAAKKPSP